MIADTARRHAHQVLVAEPDALLAVRRQQAHDLVEPRLGGLARPRRRGRPALLLGQELAGLVVGDGACLPCLGRRGPDIARRRGLGGSARGHVVEQRANELGARHRHVAPAHPGALVGLRQPPGPAQLLGQPFRRLALGQPALEVGRQAVQVRHRAPVEPLDVRRCQGLQRWLVPQHRRHVHRRAALHLLER
jgi:hypothetical protein